MDDKILKNRPDEVRHIINGLGQYAEGFLEALYLPPKRSARINTLKADVQEIAAALNLTKKSDYCPDAYLLEEDSSLSGVHPYHCGGLIYLQEPSAALAIEAARPHLTEIVNETEYPLFLDLCAAPGGKSGQLAALMKGKGVLVSNETEYSRTAALNSNMERLGVRNCMITSNRPDALAELLHGAFDAVAVDAPCSGEGMLRKEPSAWDNMNDKTVKACAARQSAIVRSAAALLKRGGIMIYSTCTLNRSENEDVLLPLIDSGEFKPLSCPHLKNVRNSALFTAYRALPQDGGGEGHFVCVLKKLSPSLPPPRFSNPFSQQYKRTAALKSALSQITVNPPTAQAYVFKNGVTLCPPLPYVKGLSVVRAGVRAAAISGSALVLEHSFAMTVLRDETVNKLNFACEIGTGNEKSAGRAALNVYLKGGAPVPSAPFSGFGLVLADGYPLGLIKAGGDGVKNRYPSGLRLRF